MQKEIPPKETATVKVKPLTATEQADLLERLKRQQKNRRFEEIGNFIAFVLCMLFASAGVVRLPERARVIGLAILAGLGFFWGIIRICISISRRPVLNSEYIAQIESAASVKPLLEMMRSVSSSSDQMTTLTALARSLSHIKFASDARLTDREYSQLLRLLEEYASFYTPGLIDRDFCVAALKALEQIGDASAIGVVKKIAASYGTTPNKNRIRNAARECLPLLRIRAELVAESQTLLRASALERAGRDTLLRPSGAPNATNPDELLRPSDPAAGC